MRSALATASDAALPAARAGAGRPRRGFLVLALLAGPVGAAVLAAAALLGLHVPLPARSASTVVTFLLLAPVLEEIVFRGGIQEMLDRTAQGQRVLVAGLTVGNVVTSALFSAAHLASSPPWLAAAVFVPSLLLGRLQQLSRSLVPVVLVHAWYNACYLSLAAVL